MVTVTESAAALRGFIAQTGLAESGQGVRGRPANKPSLANPALQSPPKTSINGPPHGHETSAKPEEYANFSPSKPRVNGHPPLAERLAANVTCTNHHRSAAVPVIPIRDNSFARDFNFPDRRHFRTQIVICHALSELMIVT